ncbi:MAG: DNA recombination protein RmuC [Anaerovoracaceae bacterium]
MLDVNKMIWIFMGLIIVLMVIIIVLLMTNRKETSRQIVHIGMENEQKLENLRKTMDAQLEQVSTGLGEMKNLALGVNDLQKILSNVKTRGILGEVQLGAILDEILSKEQYEENIKTKSYGNERVEFAVKLPGDENIPVYLPIDAKFPADIYATLIDAYEGGNREDVLFAGKSLDNAIKKAAKDIHDKYVEPPFTTDFAIMFLPFEGLYAEVIKRGLVEKLQREYKVNIAGPTTMAALLNSIQMGFKTLAIKNNTSEVWNTLASVKHEFEKFENVLETIQTRLNQTSAELDKLVGVRTRSINKKLNGVSKIEGAPQVNFEEE